MVHIYYSKNMTKLLVLIIINPYSGLILSRNVYQLRFFISRLYPHRYLCNEDSNLCPFFRKFPNEIKIYEKKY